jgi:hypothetical protein
MRVRSLHKEIQGEKDPKGHSTVQAQIPNEVSNFVIVAKEPFTEMVPWQCNVHARRNFVELESSFPEECKRVVESFSTVNGVEAEIKAAELSPEERLEEHQARSGPVMENFGPD